MSQRYNCEVCGEMYHEDNLESCKRCQRLFCYRCGGSDSRYCKYCDKPRPRKTGKSTSEAKE